MKLIVGLGNPGKEYEKTRHNMGFMAIDRLCDQINVDVDREDFKGVYARFKYQGEDIFILKPYTYMNLSGQSVKAIMQYFKIPVEDLIVVYDDLALPPGKIRMRPSGSSGGQKGIQNIIDLLGTNNIKRIRVGISSKANIDAKDYVLGRFSKEEQITLSLLKDKVVDATLEFISGKPFVITMGNYNGILI